MAALMGAVAAVPGAVPAHAATVRAEQWYIDALDVPEAQILSTGQGVTVAVIDSCGVDNTQPDLAGQLLEGTSFGIDSPHGWSSTADASHATGVAGIIAGKGGGDMGYLGIAPSAKILPIGLPVHAPSSKMAEAVRWAADHGAKVINMSFGSDGEPTGDQVDAIRYALSKDIVLVAAAGNRSTGLTAVAVPARIPGVVAVSGVEKSAVFWDGSVSGPEVAISAPAKAIIVLATKAHDPTGYGLAEGTSASAPMVAGTAALIRAKYPKLNAASVVNRLILTAKDQGPPGRDEQYGYGTLRIVDALTKNVPTVDKNPLGEPGGSGSLAAQPGSSAGGSSNGKVGPSGLIIAGILSGAVVLILLVVIGIVVASRSRKAQSPPPSLGDSYR